jgi:DNA-binding NarL/FixJ family response regulator
MHMDRIRVVIADDSNEMRIALRLLMKLYRDIELVGEATNGQEAIECVERLRPDVLLMDIRMPVVDGLAATRWIRDMAVGTRVILTSFDIGEYIVMKAAEAGAHAYLEKDDLGRQLYPMIEAILREEEFLRA